MSENLNEESPQEIIARLRRERNRARLDHDAIQAQLDSLRAELNLPPPEPAPIGLISAPHSGTRWLQDTLQIPNYWITHSHSTPEKVQWIFANTRTVVTPIRDPILSWFTIPRRQDERHYHELAEAWIALAEISVDYPLIAVNSGPHLDHPNTIPTDIECMRQEYIAYAKLPNLPGITNLLNHRREIREMLYRLGAHPPFWEWTLEEKVNPKLPPSQS